jgi:hypothetical protein
MYQLVVQVGMAVAFPSLSTALGWAGTVLVTHKQHAIGAL